MVSIKDITDLLGLSSLVTFFKKKLLLTILISVVVMETLFIAITMYPFSFTTIHSIETDGSVKLHNTSYAVKKIERKEGGVIVRLCVSEVTKTRKDNLVEK